MPPDDMSLKTCEFFRFFCLDLILRCANPFFEVEEVEDDGGDANDAEQGDSDCRDDKGKHGSSLEV